MMHSNYVTLRLKRLHSMASAGMCLSLLLLAGVGCVEGRKSTHELEHTTPAHWPTSLADAAEKIDARAARPGDEVSNRELVEIIDWLPEVAADTAMPEARWTELLERCQALDTSRKAPGFDPVNFSQQAQQLGGLLRTWHAELPQPLALEGSTDANDHPTPEQAQ